jgi:hypothetical protein
MTTPREDALNTLGAAMYIFPHLRLTQLIINACKNPDPYYVTDEDLCNQLREYIREHAPQEVKNEDS